MTHNVTRPKSGGLTSRRGLFRVGAALAITAGVGLALPGTALAYNWTRTMRRGDSGSDVRELQIRVAGWAADSPSRTYVSVDGAFGPNTEAAVKRFQTGYGLTADGIAGPQTQNVLNWLEGSDGSTRHFAWSEFHSKDGSGFSGIIRYSTFVHTDSRVEYPYGAQSWYWGVA
ncbi:MAG: hypothetical protein GEU97_05445 [Actinophytocola sp.]|nr:hypothetical protein [Actinophytocola sp.]